MRNLFYTAIVLILVAPVNLISQTSMEYHYDRSGNRVEKLILIPKTDDPNSNPLSNLQIIENKEDVKEQHNDILGNLNISIFPNPTQGKLTIEVNQNDSDPKGTVSIYSSKGEIVVQQQQLKGSNYFDISNYSSGLYFLKFRVGEEVSTWQIIKQ